MARSKPPVVIGNCDRCTHHSDDLLPLLKPIPAGVDYNVWHRDGPKEIEWLCDHCFWYLGAYPARLPENDPRNQDRS